MAPRMGLDVAVATFLPNVYTDCRTLILANADLKLPPCDDLSASPVCRARTHCLGSCFRLPSWPRELPTFATAILHGQVALGESLAD